MHEYFKWIVVVNKIVSYEYFMYEMREDEVQLCMKQLAFASKNQWEMTRMTMWSALAPHFRRGQSKSPQQLLPLPTDNEKQETKLLEKDAIAQYEQNGRAIAEFIQKQQQNT